MLNGATEKSESLMIVDEAMLQRSEPGEPRHHSTRALYLEPPNAVDQEMDELRRELASRKHREIRVRQRMQWLMIRRHLERKAILTSEQIRVGV